MYRLGAGGSVRLTGTGRRVRGTSALRRCPDRLTTSTTEPLRYCLAQWHYRTPSRPLRRTSFSGIRYTNKAVSLVSHGIGTKRMTTAVAYLRTSSRTNIDGDS